MLTARGAATLGAALTLIIAGLFRIDGAMITLGISGLLILGGNWLLSWSNLAFHKASIQAPARVFSDTPFDLRLSLHNSHPLSDSFSIDLELQLAEKSAPLQASTAWTAAQSTSTVKLRGTIPYRGEHEVHLCSISSEFPLGLIYKKQTLVISQKILVFPQAIVPKEFFATGEFDDAWNGDGYQPGNAPGEPRGLRPYSPGDTAKRLHWPATLRSLARGRAPRIRETDPPGRRPRSATVIFHSYGTDGELIRTDHFERALSLLCGTLRHLRKTGIPATLSADFLAWKDQPAFLPNAWSQTLTALAQAERASDTEAHDLKAAFLHAPKDHALIVISDMPPESWKHTLPKKPHLIVDIRQHNYSRRSLKTNTPVRAN